MKKTFRMLGYLVSVPANLQVYNILITALTYVFCMCTYIQHIRKGQNLKIYRNFAYSSPTTNVYRKPKPKIDMKYMHV